MGATGFQSHKRTHTSTEAEGLEEESLCNKRLLFRIESTTPLEHGATGTPFLRTNGDYHISHGNCYMDKVVQWLQPLKQLLRVAPIGQSEAVLPNKTTQSIFSFLSFWT